MTWWSSAAGTTASWLRPTSPAPGSRCSSSSGCTTPAAPRSRSSPFAGQPARLSRYSYLVSLMPEQLMADLDLDLRLASRTTASYTP